MENMPDIEKLREEALLYQEHQAKLRTWKLVSIGAIASVAIGITKYSELQDWIIGLLPLVSLYVDLLLRQLDLRISMIATFIRKKYQGLLADYEKAISTKEFDKIDAWRFNEITGPAITLGISILVVAMSFFQNSDVPVGLVVSSAFGVSGTLVLENAFRQRRRKIGEYDFE